MPKIKINIGAFEDLADESFDSKVKYLAVGEEVLDQHVYGDSLAKLITALGKNVNKRNLFNLEIVDGIPSALYGFTLALNSDLQPCLFFGAKSGGKDNPPNALPVEVIASEDEDSEEDYQIKVGKVSIVFHYNEDSKRTYGYLKSGKTQVSIKCDFVKDFDYDDLEEVTSTEELSNFLTKIKGGAINYKLRNLVHPDLVKSGKVKLPLILNIESFEEPYEGEDFTAVNINISSANGKPLYAIDDDGNLVEDVTAVSVYDYLNAGAVCEPANAARCLLTKVFKGEVQICITKLGKDPLKNNPVHTLRHVIPTEVEEAYALAKAELKQLLRQEQDYSHLLEPDNVEKMLAASAKPKALSAKEEDEEYEEETTKPKKAKKPAKLAEALKSIDTSEEDEEETPKPKKAKKAPKVVEVEAEEVEEDEDEELALASFKKKRNS